MTTVPEPVWVAVMAAAIVVSLGGVYVLAGPGGRWGRLLRSRLFLGVPWGTLLVVFAVAGFYLFVQDGHTDPTNPVVIPFVAWSYFYPTGILTAGFAHAGVDHVTGNLLGTLVFGSLAEYAWSHFPRRRGTSTFSSLRTNPFVRIAAWVGGVFAVGVFSAAFGLGPVIGFSGVVFAFVGFAVVRFPLLTIAAVVVSRVVTLVYNAIRTPELARTAGETTFSRPWWADIAIQGHALGLFAGVVLAVALCHRRGVRPKPQHVYLAVLVFAVDRGLWAVYIAEGGDTFRLFRALGVAVVFLLAVLVASSVSASPRTLVDRIDLSRREAAVGAVVAVLLALAVVAVPLNLFVVDDASAGLEEADPVDVGDYTVFYAEDVPHQFIPAVSMPGAEAAAPVNASGVIVVSEKRNIWWQQVSTNRLRVERSVTVRLGGVGWSEEVTASRTTWTATGGESTYNVRLGTGDERVVFRADPARADARIDGRNVSIEPVGEGFEAVVTRDEETLGRATLPGDGESTTAGGVTFERDDRTVFAEREDTRVRIASRSK